MFTRIKNCIARRHRVYVIDTVSVLLLSFFLAGHVFAEAELFVSEDRIDDRCTLLFVDPIGYFNPTDPTLVRSDSVISPSTYSHDGCLDEEFYNGNLYQDPVRVNRQRTFCVDCWLFLPSPPPSHSDATASGFADAGLLQLGAYSEVAHSRFFYLLATEKTQAQAEADPSFRNRVTILPGNSGLPTGAPVRLRWFLHLRGTTAAFGKTFPNKTTSFANVNFVAKIVREIEVCQPEDGRTFCFHPFAAQFGLEARTRAEDTDPSNPFTLGETGNISNNLSWSAQNNLGQQHGESNVEQRSVFTENDVFMSRSFAVESSSLVHFLDFEATVGETLEIQADLHTLAILGGGAGSTAGGAMGAVRNDYWGNFSNRITDPEDRGLALVFQISSETHNEQPVAQVGEDRSVQVGDMVTLNGGASTDPDNGPNPLTFRWIQKGGPAEVSLTGETTATPTFTPPLEGVYTFRLIVNDGEFDSSPAEAVVTAALTEENQSPMANAGPDQTITCAALTGAQVMLDGSGSSDPDSDPLTYTWTGSFGVVSGLSPIVSLPLGNHLITLTVEDSNGGIASDQVVITVQGATPPVAMASLAPVGKVKKKSGQFQVQFSCSNTCSSSVSTLATLNDITVTNEQVVKLILAKKAKVGQRRGILQVRAPSFNLVVTCTDAAGAVSTAIATPPFAP